MSNPYENIKATIESHIEDITPRPRRVGGSSGMLPNLPLKQKTRNLIKLPPSYPNYLTHRNSPKSASEPREKPAKEEVAAAKSSRILLKQR